MIESDIDCFSTEPKNEVVYFLDSHAACFFSSVMAHSREVRRMTCRHGGACVFNLLDATSILPYRAVHRCQMSWRNQTHEKIKFHSVLGMEQIFQSHRAAQPWKNCSKNAEIPNETTKGRVVAARLRSPAVRAVVAAWPLSVSAAINYENRLKFK
jgi:hypothetical protein